MRNMMKHLTFLAVLISCVLATHARPVPGDEALGIGGTVTRMSKIYFMMDLDKGGYLKVYVTRNTRFELNGVKSDGTHVKKGAHVRVAGTTVDGSALEALYVNVTSEPAAQDK